MQQVKVDALQKILAPVDVSRLRVFLDLVRSYRRFVKNFSLIAKLFDHCHDQGPTLDLGL